MQSQSWGSLSGSIHYKFRFLRTKSVCTRPQGAPRSEIRPIVIFKTKQTSRWNIHYNALSADGGFSFQVEAFNPPLVGCPEFRGAIQNEQGIMADIICSYDSRILSIAMKTLRLHITADKITAGKMLGRSKESDIVLAEDSIGELATILRHGHNETCREQISALFNSGFRPRGAFSETNPLPVMDPAVRQCFLAALCVYFYQLEQIYNSEGSFG